MNSRRGLLGWLLGLTAAGVAKPSTDVLSGTAAPVLEPGQCPVCYTKETNLEFPYKPADLAKGVRFTPIPKFRQMNCQSKMCNYFFNTTFPLSYIANHAECLRAQESMQIRKSGGLTDLGLAK